MEIYKSKENHKDPVKTARSNYVALSFLYIVLSILLFFGAKSKAVYYLFPSAIFLIVISYLLSKRRMIGIYLGWLFILIGVLSVFINGAWISLIVVAYLSYWNYKASENLKNDLAQNNNPIKT